MVGVFRLSLAIRAMTEWSWTRAGRGADRQAAGRLCHLHRSRRLVGPDAENAVPRRPPCHRGNRRQGGKQGVALHERRSEPCRGRAQITATRSGLSVKPRSKSRTVLGPAKMSHPAKAWARRLEKHKLG